MLSSCRLRGLDVRMIVVISMDIIWLSTGQLNMCAGTKTLLARLVNMFDAARSHHEFLFVSYS